LLELPVEIEHLLAGGERQGPRSVDMELAVLSRAFGVKWSTWWPKLKPLDKGSEVGRPIAAADESLILEAAAKSNSPYLYAYLVVEFRTGFRAGETRQLKWERFVIGPSHEESYVRTEKSKTRAANIVLFRWIKSYGQQWCNTERGTSPNSVLRCRAGMCFRLGITRRLILRVRSQT
jgi:hypothetical protein